MSRSEDEAQEELDRLINQLATFVAENGYEPEDVVIAVQDAIDEAYEEVEEEDDDEDELDEEEEDDEL